MENELEKLKRSLAEKQDEVEKLQKVLINERSDNYSKFSNYKDQLRTLRLSLKSIEKRTSGSLNEQISLVLDDLDRFLNYDNLLDEYVFSVQRQYSKMVTYLSKNYDLTDKQKIICYSIKTDMSLKQTAKLMGTTIHAIKQARSRVWKKTSFKTYEDFKLHILSL